MLPKINKITMQQNSNCSVSRLEVVLCRFMHSRYTRSAGPCSCLRAHDECATRLYYMLISARISRLHGRATNRRAWHTDDDDRAGSRAHSCVRARCAFRARTLNVHARAFVCMHGLALTLTLARANKLFVLSCLVRGIVHTLK